MVSCMNSSPFKRSSLGRSYATYGPRMFLLPTHQFPSLITLLPMKTFQNISPVLTMPCLLDWSCPTELSVGVAPSMPSMPSLSGQMTTSHIEIYLTRLKKWICDFVALSFKFNWLHEPSSSLKVSLSSVPWMLVLGITWSHLGEMAGVWAGLDLNESHCCDVKETNSFYVKLPRIWSSPV